MNPIVKYCLVAFCLSIPQYLFSQNLISENKLWRIGAKIYSEPCCSHRNDAYKFKGDSIINDTSYVKLYSSTDESLINWKLYGLWRETKDNKIFKRDLYYHTEKLLYDFALAKNDIFITQGITFKVDSVAILNWGGKLRKHWYLNPISDDTFHRTLWIEGVGQINYFISNINGGIGAEPYLLCYSESGQQVYQNPKYNTCFYTSSGMIKNPRQDFKIYPNPVSAELVVRTTLTDDEGYTLDLYSIKGELIKTKCIEPNNNDLRIDVRNLNSGTYIIRILSTSGKYAEEVFIKEK